MSDLKITIITACYNSELTIRDTIKSVLKQKSDLFDLEYIIIDGASSDGTVDIVNSFGGIAKVVSEPDNGIYNALNKGLSLATGDIVGFLHADDVYASGSVLNDVANLFKTSTCEACWGDLEYVASNDLDRVIRYWKSSPFKRNSFKFGWMPPHPSFFARKTLYERFGGFDESFKIAADYELMFRFLHINGCSTSYLPKTLVKMRMGGVSNRSINSMVHKTCEDIAVWKKHGFWFGLFYVFMKNISKLSQIRAKNLLIRKSSCFF